MKLARFARNFPGGKKTIPPLLAAFVEQSEADPACYSGLFELIDHGRESAARWFLDDVKAADRELVVFGMGPDGSDFALWTYDGRTTADAPVVFLGAQAEDSGVLADGVAGFLGLLGIGYDDLGHEWARKPPPRPDEPVRRLRAWLKRQGIAVPASAKAAVRAARRRHPDLEKTMERWQA